MATIMLVEDNVICRDLVRMLCEMDGHSVLETSSAEEALLRIRHALPTQRGADKLDLIITDFNMGQMNGYELISKLRQCDQIRNVPILMMSASNKNMREIVSPEGVGFIPKPFTNMEMIAAIRKLLKSSEPAPSSQSSYPLPEPITPSQSSYLPEPVPPSQSSYLPEPVPPSQSSYLPEPVPTSQSSCLPEPIAPSQSSYPQPAPPNPSLIAALPDKTAEPIPVFAGKEMSLLELDNNLKRLASPPPSVTQFLQSKESVARRDVQVHPSSETLESPITDLIDNIIDKAIEQQASDIHLEPQQDFLTVRIRVDGALRPLQRLPASIMENLSVRIKILCSLDITEKRLAQDGQFSRTDSQGRTTKFRVSTLPSLYGEKTVLRILPSDQLPVKLDSLGLSIRNRDHIERALQGSSGLILVTGPTGSGKTTTLYTMLEILNTPNRNIVTVEDPVEYQLKGITQVQVNPGIGYTFEHVLRSLLRQDPNVILVGEIRDAETAEIALKVAVTGHLVLSTLHTNDAPGAVQRLMSMGLPPYLVAAACRLVISQRLVRLLCPQCKAKSSLTADEASQLTEEECGRLRRVWRAVGCGACHRTGYAGRKVIGAIMPVLSQDIRQAIMKEASPEDLRSIASAEGMVPLRQEAIECAAEGLTSPEEAFINLCL